MNGRLIDARAPALSPLDRGFLYGDAIYEVWRTYRGTLFGWREHWERLQATADGIGMALPFAADEALDQIRQTAARWRELTGDGGDIYARLQISRGGGPIGLDVSLADAPSFAIYVKSLAPLSEAVLGAGVRLSVARKWRRNSTEALPPSLKTGNYLNNILGLKEAREAGADDVLFLNAAGSLTEASTRNLWLVFADRIATPKVSDGVLAGVTRRILLESTPEFEGRPLVAQCLDEAALDAAEECFLSSTTQDIQPVSRIDQRDFPCGPGSLSRRLKARFAQIVDDYVARETGLRL